MSARFEAFERADGQWEWRLVGANGQIQCGSNPQGFRDRADASRAARDVAYAVGECLGYTNDPSLVQRVRELSVFT